jgi:D-alanine transaminase
MDKVDKVDKVEEVVYLNGEYLPISQAKVSVMDRGFLFSDGVYEVMPIYNGKLMHFEPHMERLKRGLSRLKINVSFSEADVLSWIQALQSENKAHPMQTFYLQITRGSHAIRHHHYEAAVPTVFARLQKVVQRDLSHGISAIVIPDQRGMNADIKGLNRLGNVLMSQEAHHAGAEEAIVFQGGLVSEGATSNVFMVKQGEVLTPPKSAHLLSGITRDVVIEVAGQVGVNVQEKEITVSELYDADEVWIASTSRGLAPVIVLGDKLVGSGEVGAVYKTVHAAYQTKLQIWLGTVA